MQCISKRNSVAIEFQIDTKEHIFNDLKKFTNLLMSLPRADASIVRHGELRSNAFFAAFTAKSTSALSASDTSASVLPVCGFKVANFLPD